MKYLFAALAFVLAALTGWRKAEKLSEQVRLLSDIILFLNDLKSRIYYFHEPLPKIISEHSENDTVPFLKKCSYYLQTFDFPVAWKQAIDDDNFLNEKDKVLLYKFGKRIGLADAETEISVIDYILSELNLSLNGKIEKEKNDKKLYRFLGIFVGLICFLIIV